MVIEGVQGLGHSQPFKLKNVLPPFLSPSFPLPLVTNQAPLNDLLTPISPHHTPSSPPSSLHTTQHQMPGHGPPGAAAAAAAGVVVAGPPLPPPAFVPKTICVAGTYDGGIVGWEVQRGAKDAAGRAKPVALTMVRTPLGGWSCEWYLCVMCFLLRHSLLFVPGPFE